MFSIIIPNYNNARYLDELFESIINQTFENYEIIFIDDVSEDDSLEKAKEWSEKFKQNFTLIENQEKKWSGGSRNIGIDLAKGRYILFIDSDDKFASNNCLEHLVEKILTNNFPDLIRLSYWFCDGVDRYVDLSSQNTVEKIGDDCNVACWTKLIRTDKIVKFPENTLMEDVVQHLKQMDVIETIATTNEGIIKWNKQNPKSVSTQREERTTELDKKWCSSLYRYYADLLDTNLKNKVLQENKEKRMNQVLENIKTGVFIQS